MIIIKWFNGTQRCHNYIMLPLLAEVLNLKAHFNQICAFHICRERNMDADLLSKDGVQQATGSWVIKEFEGEIIRVLDQAPFSL